jgi:hypothetical protein
MNDAYIYTEKFVVHINNRAEHARYEHIGTTENEGHDTHAVIHRDLAHVFRTASEAWARANRLPAAPNMLNAAIPLDIYEEWARNPEGKNIYAEPDGTDTLGYDALCLYACLRTQIRVADSSVHPAEALLGLLELSGMESCDRIDAELREILSDLSHPEHAEVWENCLAVMIVKDREQNAYKLAFNEHLYLIPVGIPIPKQYYTELNHG